MSQFHQFLDDLRKDCWLITDPSLPLGWLQGTFMDFTTEEVFTYSALLLGLILLLCPVHNPHSPPIPLPHDAPAQQEVVRRTTTPISPLLKKQKREEC